MKKIINEENNFPGYKEKEIWIWTQACVQYPCVYYYSELIFWILIGKEELNLKIT